MSSIVYGGNDFGAYTAAHVHDLPAQVVEPVCAGIPGRAGEVVVRGHVTPRRIRVELAVNPALYGDADGLDEVKRTLAGWLAVPEGARLALPGQGGLYYEDAIVTGVSEFYDDAEWRGFEVVFTAYDPIRWGPLHIDYTTELSVAGTWETVPTVTMTASAGDAVSVTNGYGPRTVTVSHAFSGGEAVVLDFEAETATIDGEDASAEVTLESTFFSLRPGEVYLSFEGCESHSVSYNERWA